MTMHRVDVMAKIILLTGAPIKHLLSWNEDDLTAPIQGAFLDFVDDGSKNIATDKLAKWRLVPFHESITQPKPTHKKPHKEERHNGTQNSREKTAFLNIHDLHCRDRPKDALTEFLQHSFAVHEDIQDPLSRKGSPNSANVLEVTTSTNSNKSSFATSIDSEKSAQPVLKPNKITSLRDIPSASDISFLLPQKIIRTFIVTVLSVLPPRQIHSHRRQQLQDSELICLTVADDTCSGFSINIWLDSTTIKPDQKERKAKLNNSWNATVRRTTLNIKTRDVLLIQNVSLHVYQGRIYANSLRGMTRLEVLYQTERQSGLRSRRRARFKTKHIHEVKNGADTDPVLRKTAKVVQWMEDFLIPGVRYHDPEMDNTQIEDRKPKRMRIELPPDTQ
jgi:hypothetical protein